MDKQNSTQSVQVIGSYEINGATVLVNKGEAVDMASMKAGQLKALSNIIGAENFSDWNSEIQSYAKSLANSLAEEMAALVEIVARDASTI